MLKHILCKNEILCYFILWRFYHVSSSESFFSIQISILIVQVYTIISNKQDVLIDYMGLISALKLFIMFLPYFDCSERKNTVKKTYLGIVVILVY